MMIILRRSATHGLVRLGVFNKACNQMEVFPSDFYSRNTPP